MTLAIIESEMDGISVYYMDLISDFGFYRSKPDDTPYICLNKSLLEGDDDFHFVVYQTLLNYHNSLDTWQRLVPLVRYFKCLMPDWKELLFEEKPLEPEIIIIGRAIRLWRFLPQDEQARVIGGDQMAS
jgi:hypothetical protein